MSRYQSIGLSLLPERLRRIDDRAEKLGLTRSKYFQALVDADIDGELLDSTIDAEGGEPVVKVREGVSVVVLDREVVKSLSVEIAVTTINTLARLGPDLQLRALVGNTKKMAEQVVRTMG